MARALETMCALRGDEIERQIYGVFLCVCHLDYNVLGKVGGGDLI